MLVITNRKPFLCESEDTEREGSESERRIHWAAKAASMLGSFGFAFWNDKILYFGKCKIHLQLCMRPRVEEHWSPLISLPCEHRLGRASQRQGWNSLKDKEELLRGVPGRFRPTVYSSSQQPVSASSFQPESWLRGLYSWVKLAASELFACQNPCRLAQEQRFLLKLSVSAKLIPLNSKWPSIEESSLRRMLL